MSLTELNAISPIDGRYRSKTKIFSAFFSEEALIKYRLEVEIEYFIALCELPLPELSSFDSSVFEKLRNLYKNFSTDYAIQIKENFHVPSLWSSPIPALGASVTRMVLSKLWELKKE